MLCMRVSARFGGEFSEPGSGNRLLAAVAPKQISKGFLQDLHPKALLGWIAQDAKILSLGGPAERMWSY